MFRMLRISIVAVVVLFLTALAWAGESEDTQQVRDLLYKEQDSYLKADTEQLLSCYSPDFVGYWGSGEGPELWSVVVVGLDSLRSQYAAQAKQMVDWLAKHPEVTFGNEVVHINIKNDRAIALTQHWATIPDTTARETIAGKHQSVWMLAKINDEWKITSFIGQVILEQTVWKQGPE